MIKALLTGHSRGLGAALASALLARGIGVLGIARTANPALAGAPLLQELTLDLSDPAALAAWLAGPALTDFLHGAELALLINNAGLLQPVGPAGTLDAAALVRALQVNVTAPLLLANAFVAASAACPARRILHVSSGAARSAYAGWSSYCASKAALDHHARALALEAHPGLAIESLAPGVIDTAMQAEIRAVPVELFPLKSRFEALKADGQLASPADTARHLVSHLLGPHFGAVVDGDLRNLPD